MVRAAGAETARIFSGASGGVKRPTMMEGASAQSQEMALSATAHRCDDSFLHGPPFR
jgi:hypothetical protein